MWITLNLSQLLRVLYTSSEHSGSRKAGETFLEDFRERVILVPGLKRGVSSSRQCWRETGVQSEAKVMMSRGGVARPGQAGGKVR